METAALPSPAAAATPCLVPFRTSPADALGLFQRLAEELVTDLSPYPQIRQAFEGLLSEQGGAHTGSVALTQALMTQCLVYLFRSLLEQPRERPLLWLTLIQGPDLAPAVDLMFEHPARPHSMETLAEAALMSRSVFAERFRKVFGCPPMTFLHEVRLCRASALLVQQKDLTLDKIAHRVGFRSRSHFSQVFRDRFGIPPASFRSHPVLSGAD